jgi:hypothetical protein
MTKARDLSKLLSTANGKIAGANLDVSFENISDTGTAGTKVASGTTEQRGSTAGQIRFNTTTGLAEYYTGSIFKIIDSPPTVTAVSPLDVDSTSGGNITFTITGTNFGSGAVVKFVANDATEITASTTTVNSGSSISAVIARSSFVNAKEPYDIKVINISGLSGTLDNQINVDASPAWSTASGTLATINDTTTGTHSTVSATDADGDTVSYSETGGTVLTTAGLTLNSSTGAISGDPTNVGSSTTYSFTLRATANSKTVDRAFNIIVNPTLDGTSSGRAFNTVSDGDSHVVNGNQYYIKTSSGASEQLYFYKYNNYAYALVGLRYQSSSSQTNINNNSPVGSISNQATFHLGTTKINYINNQVGLLLIPQQASGILNTANIYANLFRNNSLPEIPSDTFTNNHAGEGSGGFQVRGINLSTLNPNSVPTNNFYSLNTNDHDGGNQILTYFGDADNISNGGVEPLGIRWSSNSGNGYNDGVYAGNDVTGGGRDLSASPIISLFLLAR